MLNLENKNIFALICARAGSKGLPDKNINFLTIQLSLLYLYLQLTGALIATILNGKINALLNVFAINV